MPPLQIEPLLAAAVVRRLLLVSLQCLLMALSGHFWTARSMSAFVGKADISDACSNVCL